MIFERDHKPVSADPHPIANSWASEVGRRLSGIFTFSAGIILSVKCCFIFFIKNQSDKKYGTVAALYKALGTYIHDQERE